VLKEIERKILDIALDPEVEARIDRAPLHLNSAGFDPWGLDPHAAKRFVILINWLYRKYFRVQAVGVENIPEERVIIASNHSGQFPVDGLMLALSLLLEPDPPRIARGMVERWAPTIPFISTLLSRCGQVVGDPQNARELLEHDECIMVFPEGARGLGKTVFRRYQLQRFGTGFVRLALETKTPIIPTAMIGCEETYPGILQFKPLAKLFRTPYFPITPFFPWLGAFGLLPLPTKITIRYGKPILFEGDPDAPDEEIQAMVHRVQGALQDELATGLEIRKDRIFTGAAK
jgi:1-acyl-sn-glycerol-3-phosphate acyltransferase